MNRAARWSMVLILGMGLIGCDSGDKKSSSAKAPPPKKAPQAAPEPPPPPPPPPDAQPEPMTPEAIEQARREAMLKGRDADVIKYCEMAGIEAGKSDPQALLGCTLSACRIKDQARAKAWSQSLPRPLMQQAMKICAASAVSLK